MTFIHRPPITGFMTGYDQDQRVWIQGILDRMGITATELARRANLDPSTLTRPSRGMGATGRYTTSRVGTKEMP